MAREFSKPKFRQMNNVMGEGENIGFDYQMGRDSIAILAMADIVLT
jgi:hypothetical protein